MPAGGNVLVLGILEPFRRREDAILEHGRAFRTSLGQRRQQLEFVALEPDRHLLALQVGRSCNARVFPGDSSGTSSPQLSPTTHATQPMLYSLHILRRSKVCTQHQPDPGPPL